MLKTTTSISRILCICILVLSVCCFEACSVQKKIAKKAHAAIFADSNFTSAHIGISVFDANENKYLYNFQGDKYFVPASNTKLFTCYAGMKYLGDSILAAKYFMEDSHVTLIATGDPTFLHPDFKDQRLYNFLKQSSIDSIDIATPFASQPLGRGWAWDDFMDDYMAERDPFPMYGNTVTFINDPDSLRVIPPSLKKFAIGLPQPNKPWQVSRNLGGHFYTVNDNTGTTAKQKTVTIAMEKGAFAASLLSDTLHKPVNQTDHPANIALNNFYSQHADSLFKIMMHRSDNFFAEQTLLMASNALLGVMDDTKMIATLLATDYAGAPQKPKWVDGSGLSRYNLFTPQDFIWILNKYKTDFGMERMKVILPTGGEGTLSSLYKDYTGSIFAKTGTLSNHVALSGYLFTKKNKMLIFSVLVNNQQASATAIRNGIEKFVTALIEKY